MKAAIASAIRAALAAADPVAAFRARVSTATAHMFTLDGGARVFDFSSATSALVVGAGKASVALAAEVVRALGRLDPPLRVDGGLIVTRDGHAAESDANELARAGVGLRFASHPVPDGRGVAAASELLSLVRARARGVAVIVCLSGGASALLPAPAAGLSLDDLSSLGSLLLASGAPIADVNAVRKHCSEIAGGRLGAAAADAGAIGVLTLAVSDVVGDALDVIGSGPTVRDESTFADAARVLRECAPNGAGVPAAVAAHIAAGVAGEREETDKVTSRRGHDFWLLSTNNSATSAAAAAFSAHGWSARVVANDLVGDAARVAATRLAAALTATPPHSVLIYGGETTVVLGVSRAPGGRNQELALATAVESARISDGSAGGGGSGCAPASWDTLRWAVACIATDGTDGTTDAAGAIVTSETASAAARRGLDMRVALQSHEAHALLKCLGGDGRDALLPGAEGGLLVTGPTGTNVMDLAFVVKM